jgi:uncharacterized protein (DUF952 family)
MTPDVIFHIAARGDWDRARKTGSYVAESLGTDGFIHCATEEQYVNVANDLFAGRTDLVLLFIDRARLASGVRFEEGSAGADPFPHVYGSINVDAVFEAAPFIPDVDGLFTAHVEAMGYVLFGAATLDEAKLKTARTMAGSPFRWWVAGGWAIDIFLGAKTRPHPDLEIAILAGDQAALHAHLAGWQLRLAAPGGTFPAWDGGEIRPPYHQVWARRGGGRAEVPEDFARDPSSVDFLLEDHDGELWVYRRNPAVTRPVADFGSLSPDGVPHVRPEVALLFKSKSTRYKDHLDFDAVLPHLAGDAREWLARALEIADHRHAWLKWL